MSEGTILLEIDAHYPIWSMLFSASGEYLVGSSDNAVQVWQVANGEEVATMTTCDVRSIAISNDGKRIASGTKLGRVIVWTHGERTHKRIFSHKENGSTITTVDFSPDSLRLVAASSNSTVSVWDVATSDRVLGPLHHQHSVIAARYSPQGDRIATCTDHGLLRIYDGCTGHLIVNIPDRVASLNCDEVGLTWSDDGQRVSTTTCDGIIKQIQISSGKVVSEWPMLEDYRTCICISTSRRGEVVAHASNSTNGNSAIKILHASRGILGKPIKYDKEVRSVAISPDDRLLAVGTEDGKIIIRNLSQDTPGSGSLLPESFNGPFIHVGGAVLDSWQQGNLERAEALLTHDIDNSSNLEHRTLAYRALVRTRLKQWDAARCDAEKSIEICPSVIGLIAKGVVVAGEKNILEAKRMFDLAFKHCDPDRIDILLAIKAVVVCVAGEHEDAISRAGDLIATAQGDPIYLTIQAYMHLLHGISLRKGEDYEGAIRSFKHAQVPIQHYASRRLRMISLMFGWRFDDLSLTTQRNLCEALCAAGRMKEAEDTLIMITNDKNEDTELTEWISSFTQRCLLSLESGEGSTSSSPHLSAPRPLLVEWARTALTRISWKDVLVVATRFTVPRIMIYRTICERLEMADLLMDAIDCFHQMAGELALTTHEDVEWIIDFKCRCSKKLETAGDAATNARRHDDAIMRYSASLSLYPTNPQARLASRSKVYVTKGLWREASWDADEMIKLDLSSPLGYERRYAALWGEHRYEEAKDAFQTMLMKMSESPDPRTRARSGRYVTPEMTRTTIGEVVRAVVTKLPLVLINTMSGRLCDRIDLLSMFESQPIFTELVTTTTTQIDRTRIEHEVAEYYHYAALSHTWEKDEPLFKDVTSVAVYDLEKSFAHEKLQMFCKIARDAGLHWAWSDTCCIDKGNHVVLQEALVAMFKWYQGSALTVISLRGIRRPSRRGDLMHSAWNTRAWTLQEYHASKVVRFYTEDWIPYLDLDLPNHKESSEIISEMEDATRISADDLKMLQPGLDHIRDKLRLASKRNATRVEDKAYCLLGIFSATLPLVYGEGEKALGRLLAQLLTSSGDTSILAWSGPAGEFNSCLPQDIAVFDRFPTTHIPAIDTEPMVDKPWASSLNPALVMQVYDRIKELPAPEFAGQRMKLPCIVFKLGRLARSSSMDGHVFRAQVGAAIGTVEIRTAMDLGQLGHLYLIHPWIDFLLHGQLAGNVKEMTSNNTADLLSEGDPEPLTALPPIAPIQARSGSFMARLGVSFSSRSSAFPQNVEYLQAPSIISPTDREAQALQLIARLMQPFGALLFTQKRQDPRKYERVAAESMITFQVQEMSTRVLTELLPSTCTLDVL